MECNCKTVFKNLSEFIQWIKNKDTVCTSCPLVILEAFSTDIPVVASSTGGVPEIIDDGENGFMFSVGDSDELAKQMKKLLKSPALRAQFAYISRTKIIKNFTIKRMTARLVEIR